jgi:uncharacterized protein (DUF486 family)
MLYFILLMIIPTIFYSLATFYNLSYPSSTMTKAIMIAVLFATIEYIFKIPIIKYGHNNGITRTQIQFIWIGLTLISAFLIDKYMHKEQN